MSNTITKEILEKIGVYITEGMNEEESCILSDVRPKELITLKERNENIRNYIEKQKTKFKHQHLKEMQTKKSDKTSQWLLERLRPEDFNIGSRSKSNTTINIVGNIIKEIQDGEQPIIVQNRQKRLEAKSEPDTEPREVHILDQGGTGVQGKSKKSKVENK